MLLQPQMRFPLVRHSLCVLIHPGVVDERKFVVTPSFPAALRPSSNRTFAITAKDVYGTVIPCTSSSATRVTMEPNLIVAQSCSGDQFEITVRGPDAEGTHNDVEFRFDQILFKNGTLQVTHGLIYIAS